MPAFLLYQLKEHHGTEIGLVFWGIEEYFKKLEGVKKTCVGYSGGSLSNPDYKNVCTGKTGHAEVVLIEYDEVLLSYVELLNHFWRCHDPTQINGQGLDIGTQYRSIIFYYLVDSLYYYFHMRM